MARYRELREEHYGGHTFDFGVGPLNTLTEQVALAGDLDAALAMIELNLEYHPDDAWSHHLRGEVLMRQDEREAALEAFRRSLELDPDNRRARQRIDELSAPESGEGGEEADAGG